VACVALPGCHSHDARRPSRERLIELADAVEASWFEEAKEVQAERLAEAEAEAARLRRERNPFRFKESDESEAAS
jgi:hypothetical protein